MQENLDSSRDIENGDKGALGNGGTTLSKVEIKESVFIVTGMTCASCSSAIEKHLKSLEGIQEVNVSLLTNKALIKY